MKIFQTIKNYGFCFRLFALFISILFAKISCDVSMISTFVVHPELKGNLGANSSFLRY